MSYTFGGATNDLLRSTGANMMGGTSQGLVAGWWYPTTLTAGRYYWGAGSGSGNLGLRVDTTTSELRLIVDCATTDAEFVTSGAGVVVDVWQFIAVLYATSGSSFAFRVWVGTRDTQPAMFTPTESVAGSGSSNAENAVCVGNAGVVNASFQGDVGNALFTGWGNTNILGPYCNGGGGSIDDATAKYNENKWVLPLWRNRFHTSGQYQGITATTQSRGGVNFNLDDVLLRCMPIGLANGVANIGVTVTNVVRTGAAPVRWHHDNMMQRTFVPGFAPSM